LVPCNIYFADSDSVLLINQLVFKFSATSRKDQERERHHGIILHSIERMEQKLHKAVEDEVRTLFPKQGKDQDVKEKAQAAIARSSKKARQVVDDHADATKLPFEDHPYPYSWPKPKYDEHADHKVLHAIGSAEHAVLHAVDEEVGLIFQGTKQAEKDATKNVESVLKHSVEKTKSKVKKEHDERQHWLKDSENPVEEYLRSGLE